MLALLQPEKKKKKKDLHAVRHAGPFLSVSDVDWREAVIVSALTT